MDILLLSKKWTFPLLLIGIFSQTCLVVSESASSSDFNDTCNTFSDPCKNGLIIPRWEPTGNLSVGDKVARAIIYFVLMVYLFLGVSIIADRFMASIEVITSKEKDVTVKKPDGTTTIVSVRIWNETVSNLTLMALGSSAPEIMLSVIEICGNNFKAGDLGPSTIVGSAAFNLFIITALCIEVIPNGESRSINHLSVFFITSIWSVFAYLWLYFILSVISYGIVEVWEAILTFLFFPATVVTAYVADRKLLNKFISKKYRASKQKGVVIQCEGLDIENADSKANHLGEDVAFKGLDSEETDVREFEQHRREYIEILREMRKKNPTLDMKTLEDMAEAEAVNRGPKSRAFYRIQATRKLTGGGNIIKKAKTQTSMQLSSTTDQKPEDEITKVCFDPGHYTVMENVGTFYGTVTREGGDLSKTLYVDYKTEDGTANAGSDYVYAEGTLVFYPMETHKQFPISIIDDDIFEEDEHFYIRLSNLRVGDSQGLFESGQAEAKAILANPFLATVMILDDDHPGIFQIEEKEMYITESSGEVEIRIIRTSGARGLVKVPFHSVDGTAVHGKDYELLDKEVCFDNDENEKFLRVRVFDDEEYEKNETFFIWLDEPFLVKKPADTDSAHSGSSSENVQQEEDDPVLVELGKPRRGENIKITVHITESTEFKSVVDKLLKKANLSLVVSTSSWREQFIEAITVNAEGDDDDDGEEEKLPSCMDYIMHFVCLFWKVLFAFVPPTEYWGGWACFTVSICLIGVLTAFIGDFASHFGCTIGLKDAVTAVSFVALGTSVPDTFASKVAAVNDKYADSSIGNVTGSNAVNVFLGIGIAWSIAAIYHAANGSVFRVHPGTLAFSVTVFCVFAFFTTLILVLRRHKKVGGELGGPPVYRHVAASIFILFWVIYILLTSLMSYCYIEAF
ncbi:sodium/calcium exchanger 1-like isoform X3 [Octopus sinensis]|uniref:Sodium/calcium exchanger 1-like isoform X3 n=1 Tax=Octopus sinensis TaxID=2607531 RepID=A0A7E6EYF5_9MOLL|nr:sodium/calcium exchanger 1-like isoform X3 [Octopus sinensis]